MAKDLFSTLKVYLTKITDGERTPKEIVSELNTWAHESAESIKSKIEEEVEKSVSKMGFVKREEFEALKAELAASKKAGPKVATAKKAPAKKTPIKKVAKKTSVKRAAVKKAVKK